MITWEWCQGREVLEVIIPNPSLLNRQLLCSIRKTDISSDFRCHQGSFDILNVFEHICAIKRKLMNNSPIWEKKCSFGEIIFEKNMCWHNPQWEAVVLNVKSWKWQRTNCKLTETEQISYTPKFRRKNVPPLISEEKIVYPPWFWYPRHISNEWSPKLQWLGNPAHLNQFLQILFRLLFF
jgi:hypothetical protein